MQDYKKLSIWQRAHALNLKAHRLVRRFPPGYAGLIGQIRRSADEIFESFEQDIEILRRMLIAFIKRLRG